MGSFPFRGGFRSRGSDMGEFSVPGWVVLGGGAFGRTFRSGGRVGSVRSGAPFGEGGSVLRWGVFRTNIEQ